MCSFGSLSISPVVVGLCCSRSFGWQTFPAAPVCAAMAGARLVGSGELNAGALPGTDSGVATSVIAALGARGVGQSSLLNALVGSSLPTGALPAKQTTVGVDAFVHPGDASAAQAGPPRRLVVLDVEGYDGADRSREETRDRAANLAVALSDVMLFSVRMNDLPRMESNGVAGLRVGLTESFKLLEAGILDQSEDKKLFIVVVRDYDAETLPREELISGFLRELQSVFESVSKPSRIPTNISELYDFEFITLPSSILAPEAFEDSVAIFRERLTDPFADDCFFAEGKYARNADKALPELSSSIWDGLEEEEMRDLPAGKELTASFACAAAVRKVYEKYARLAPRTWEREVDEGNVIEDFGREASVLLDETLAVFDNDVGPHRTSKAFQRKRYELKSMIDANTYDLFTRQIRRLREVAYGMFKEELEEIQSDESGFEKNIKKAVHKAQKHFLAEAEKLRPSGSSWRFDNESKELASHMHEDATERLQQARLEEYSAGARGRGGRRGGRGGRGGRGRPGGSKRQPISISFHYLDPAPFGWKDSRYEKLNTDDPLQYREAPTEAASDKSVAPTLPILPGKNEAWDRDYIYQETPGGGR